MLNKYKRNAIHKNIHIIIREKKQKNLKKNCYKNKYY